MIKVAKARMGKSQEEGFTLIELMVVVLILGILMAIAIPTFLSLTASAKTNAAESDLTVAAQDEAVYFTQNGTYDVSATANVADMQTIDTGLNWTTAGIGTQGTKTVFIAGVATATGVAGTDNQVVFGTAASNKNEYWVQDTQGTLLYAVTTSAVTGSPIAGDFTGHTSWASLASLTPATT